MPKTRNEVSKKHGDKLEPLIERAGNRPPQEAEGTEDDPALLRDDDDENDDPALLQDDDDEDAQNDDVDERRDIGERDD